MVAPTQLPGRAFAQISRRSRLLFSWRARDLGLDSIGGVSPTFARASDGGLVLGRGGQSWHGSELLRMVGPHADDIPRFEHVLNSDGIYVPASRLEAARTNSFTRSEQLDDAAWTKTRSSVSADAIRAPDGKVTADKLVEDATASNSHTTGRFTPSLTDNTVSTFSVFAKAGERTEIQMVFFPKGGASGNAWFDLSTGVLGTETGLTATMEDVGDGWYRCTVSEDVSSGGGTPEVEIRLGSGSETLQYDGDGVSGAYLWGMQLEADQPVASTYIPTVGSTVTRALDKVFWEYLAVPQAMTIYNKVVGFHGGHLAGTFWKIGSAAVDAEPRIKCFIDSSGAIGAQYEGDTSEADTGVVSAPAEGVTLEMLVTLTAAGVVDLAVSTDGAGQENVASAAGDPLPAAWVAERIYMNSSGDAGQGVLSHTDLKVAAGIQTMDFMREVI